MTLINVKIDVNKIDKSRFFQGKKGKYLNITLIPTPDSKYSDYMVVHEQTKEERAKKEKSIILGNAKLFETKGGNGNGKPAQSEGGGGDDGW